jgi:trehalose-6-phosphate synthase
MANPNFKGRPVGTGKNTFIEDPLFGNFKIMVDEYSYTVIDSTKNKTVGFYTNISNAIFKIARHQMMEDRTYSLKEYADEFNQKCAELKNAII